MTGVELESCGEAVAISYLDEGKGAAVLLVHGFASTKEVNWVQPGWVRALIGAGFRAIAFDNRGHGASTKFHDANSYRLECFVSDAVGLLDRLGIERAHLVGYSMGARICAAIAISHPQRVGRVVLSGNGWNMIEQTMDWVLVREALLSDNPKAITDARAIAFRTFADRTGNDRKALAACIAGARRTFSQDEIASVRTPVLVAIGSADDVAGSGERLAALIPGARFYSIPGRDHMKAVGDKGHIAAAIAFLAEGMR